MGNLDHFEEYFRDFKDSIKENNEKQTEILDEQRKIQKENQELIRNQTRFNRILAITTAILASSAVVAMNMSTTLELLEYTSSRETLFFIILGELFLIIVLTVFILLVSGWKKYIRDR